MLAVGLNRGSYAAPQMHHSCMSRPDVGLKRRRFGQLVQADVNNAQQYGEYAKLTPAIVEQYGGRFLARAGRNVTLEGAKAPARVVVIEFPSFEKAQEFYNSPAYQAARKVRAGAATAQLVVVEGL